MAADVLSWLQKHIYVPILSSIFVVVILCLVIFCYCRYRKKYKFPYTRIGEYDVALAEQLQREKAEKQNAVRDTAYMKCQFYLRSHPQYDSVQQFKELGSRIDKHWFRVRDTHTRIEYILSIMPYNPKMVLPFTPATSKTLKDLFSLLQHPYIFPVHDFDFAVDQQSVVTVHPISIRGSLKDIIYQRKFEESWYEKYTQRNRGLTLLQIQSYGRQVLEALLYLEDKGFPQNGNIHSGNVLFENGVCRLGGYENSFLGNTSRIFPVIKKKLKGDKDALDALSFGHLLFEMCFGYELDVAQPEPQQLLGNQSPKIVEILNFIFENENRKYPTVKEICHHSFFSSVHLDALLLYNPAPINLNSTMKTLLKNAKKGKPLKSKSKADSRKSDSKKHSSGHSSAVYTNSAEKLSVLAQSPPNTAAAPPVAPPPPPALTTVTVEIEQPGSSRQVLLGDIRKGSNLKKTVTNDKSNPKI